MLKEGPNLSSSSTTRSMARKRTLDSNCNFRDEAHFEVTNTQGEDTVFQTSARRKMTRKSKYKLIRNRKDCRRMIGKDNLPFFDIASRDERRQVMEKFKNFKTKRQEPPSLSTELNDYLNKIKPIEEKKSTEEVGFTIENEFWKGLGYKKIFTPSTSYVKYYRNNPNYSASRDFGIILYSDFRDVYCVTCTEKLKIDLYAEIPIPNDLKEICKRKYCKQKSAEGIPSASSANFDVDYENMNRFITDFCQNATSKNEIYRVADKYYSLKKAQNKDKDNPEEGKLDEFIPLDASSSSKSLESGVSKASRNKRKPKTQSRSRSKKRGSKRTQIEEIKGAEKNFKTLEVAFKKQFSTRTTLEEELNILEFTWKEKYTFQFYVICLQVIDFLDDPLCCRKPAPFFHEPCALSTEKKKRDRFCVFCPLTQYENKAQRNLRTPRKEFDTQKNFIKFLAQKRFLESKYNLAIKHLQRGMYELKKFKNEEGYVFQQIIHHNFKHRNVLDNSWLVLEEEEISDLKVNENMNSSLFEARNNLIDSFMAENGIKKRHRDYLVKVVNNYLKSERDFLHQKEEEANDPTQKGKESQLLVPQIGDGKVKYGLWEHYDIKKLSKKKFIELIDKIKIARLKNIVKNYTSVSKPGEMSRGRVRRTIKKSSSQMGSPQFDLQDSPRCKTIKECDDFLKQELVKSYLKSDEKSISAANCKFYYDDQAGMLKEILLHDNDYRAPGIVDYQKYYSANDRVTEIPFVFDDEVQIAPNISKRLKKKKNKANPLRSADRSFLEMKQNANEAGYQRTMLLPQFDFPKNLRSSKQSIEIVNQKNTHSTQALERLRTPRFMLNRKRTKHVKISHQERIKHIQKCYQRLISESLPSIQKKKTLDKEEMKLLLSSLYPLAENIFKRFELGAIPSKLSFSKFLELFDSVKFLALVNPKVTKPSKKIAPKKKLAKSASVVRRKYNKLKQPEKRPSNPMLLGAQGLTKKREIKGVRKKSRTNLTQPRETPKNRKMGFRWRKNPPKIDTPKKQQRTSSLCKQRYMRSRFPVKRQSVKARSSRREIDPKFHLQMLIGQEELQDLVNYSYQELKVSKPILRKPRNLRNIIYYHPVASSHLGLPRYQKFRTKSVLYKDELLYSSYLRAHHQELASRGVYYGDLSYTQLYHLLCVKITEALYDMIAVQVHKDQIQSALSVKEIQEIPEKDFQNLAAMLLRFENSTSQTKRYTKRDFVRTKNLQKVRKGNKKSAKSEEKMTVLYTDSEKNLSKSKTSSRGLKEIQVPTGPVPNFKDKDPSLQYLDPEQLQILGLMKEEQEAQKAKRIKKTRRILQAQSSEEEKSEKKQKKKSKSKKKKKSKSKSKSKKKDRPLKKENDKAPYLQNMTDNKPKEVDMDIDSSFNSKQDYAEPPTPRVIHRETSNVRNISHKMEDIDDYLDKLFSENY
ncbi:unnamed protein product [Moneuplotes crassus]|uniref:Uncharacterized protein n=1 Tax=Euplotes crassus TaxID=5936 RepID=A0AAD1TZR6_EUPCR|nr:unnamed protein product [Moneuplotes crassus]